MVHGVVVVTQPLGFVHVSDELFTGFFVDSIETAVLVSGSLLISIISVGLTGPVPDSTRPATNYMRDIENRFIFALFLKICILTNYLKFQKYFSFLTIIISINTKIQHVFTIRTRYQIRIQNSQI